MVKRKKRPRPDYKALFDGSEKISDSRAKRIERLETDLQVEIRTRHLAERALEVFKKREERFEAALENERRTTDRLLTRLMCMLAEAVPTIGLENK